ncbi:plasminogen-binding N-terminal domain-containing protein [Hydrogenimonas sp. SS33]|uniref:plasminogen-binding N-terminal domain-containing protein n=1 Tax=Hydrogenimonas leucolamina TaxID=2954236 RepID=UPI00336BFADE
MKLFKTLFLISLAAGTLFAAEPRSETGTLQQVSGKTGTVDLKNIPAGVSGIVIHTYNPTHKAIVASAVVTRSDAAQTSIKLLPYTGLKQPNLPSVKTPPRQGDTVILGYLYDRVLPIVPNRKSFDKARKSFSKLHIIHPDLMAAELAKDKSPIPDKEHFQRMCDKFALGIVMFMYADGTDFLDCKSWQKVAHVDVASVEPKKFKQPFYNRFEEIPSPFYDWTEHKIDDFDRFYKRLEQQK